MDDTLNTRFAEQSDVPAIEALIARSVMELMANEYSVEQRRLSIGALFGVDRRIIEDRTYFIVESEQTMIGCGGWSFRRTLFGGEAVAGRDAGCLDPRTDAAYIRAFYVHPDHARRGVAQLLMTKSADAARERGFTKLALAATLTGERFYTRYGFKAGKRFDFELPQDVRFPLVNMELDFADRQARG